MTKLVFFFDRGNNNNKVALHIRWELRINCPYALSAETYFHVQHL